MKRAAIYARYSSDLQSPTSIEDQVRLCRRRASEIGAEVVDVYSDAAISGARLLGRPEIARMLKDAKAGRIDIVIAEALDRLSRDQEDIAAIYKRLAHAGVTVLTLAEGEISPMHIGFKGTMNALFLKDLGMRVRRGQSGRVKAGRAPGGLVYGYRVVPRFDEKNEPVRGLREVDPEQAAVVVRIYEQYAAGMSPRAIAGALNADSIPSPRGRQWNASTITGQRKRLNGLLHNPIYIGRIVYNRQGFRIDPDTGSRTAVTNPESEWETQEVPSLRIISDELWQKVQRHLVLRRCGSENPGRQRRPKHLLSGLVTCGCCGSTYIMVDAEYLGCRRRREGGDCSNGRRIKASRLENEILSGLSEDLMRPEAIAAFIDEYESQARAISADAKRRRASTAKVERETSAQIERLVAAIADGIDTPAMRLKLVQLEKRREEIRTEAAMAPTDGVLELHPNLADFYRARLDRLREALTAPSERTEAATLLRGLIDQIVLHPTAGKRGLEAEIVSQVSALSALVQGKNKAKPELVMSVASPTGFEPVLPT
ncbi:recombinase family protein [Dongia sp.]|uniref:recombinase family protein n=1 Tax=Dongia sp. TaxID=1977262 RepID=UPI0035B2B127